MNTDKHRYKKLLFSSRSICLFKKTSASICVYLWLIILFTFSQVAYSQVRPVNDYGALGLGQLLKRLNTTASVMMIGAHPDDEDSALLAYLARGENARTAYLSLTRGDGGQNIIGPELFESLGVIRTEELLQARRLDGAEQYFTRAFDYGFSKTLTEARAKWDEKIILCDTVRAIRTFRPLVVILRFSGTPADGHGQHQYAGYITPIAVKAAADVNQCGTESGGPWQVLKFYVEQGFGASDTASLKLNTGAYDPILGRSYFEIAMEGRSQHRSQGEGRIEFHGDQFSGLNLVESKVPMVESEKSVFDGIDTSIDTSLLVSQKITQLSEAEEKAEFSKISAAAKRALKEYEPIYPHKIIPILLEGVMAIGKINRSTARASGLYQKQREFSEAIKCASGIRIDALADRETVAPDEPFVTAVKVFLPKLINAKVKKIDLRYPDNWTVQESITSNEANLNSFRREIATQSRYFTVRVGSNEKPTQPYWLEMGRQDNLFNGDFFRKQDRPFQPPPLDALAVIEIEGNEFYFYQPVQYRFADPSRGEIRRELNVVPKISLSLDNELLIFPQNARDRTKRIVLSVANNSTSIINGEARLRLPNGWKATPEVMSFSLKNKGARAAITFDVTFFAKFNSAEFELAALATANGETFTSTMHEITYPHIQTHRNYTNTNAKLLVLDLMTVPAKIGYIMGSGDEVPEAIRQMGFDVTMLEEKDLASGDLSKFDTVVVGIRASETRADFVANNQRLLDYVKNGGNLILQYQRGNFAQSGLTPYPVNTTDTQKTTAGSIARVVDENAKVTILQPDSPVFNTPNKITDEDFKGWVQERNAYNLVTFDPQYTPLLESHDAGELENKGGLVITKVGKGNYIYCSYSMFRQLPAGVPGAYRLFANILSLPKSQNGKR